jgi:mono/diheme cytochrome c family protein
MSARASTALLALALAACHPSDVDPMKTQDKILPYRVTAAFADHAGMRIPPDGTVPRERVLDPGPGFGGDAQGQPLKIIPVPVDLVLLERGRTVYEGTCAACHGVLGDGNSEVASKMSLIKPTSLHANRVLALPPGELYRVIINGYGLMNSYAEQISVRDRWAVVAYVQALQLSQDARLADLPAAEQERLRQGAP